MSVFFKLPVVYSHIAVVDSKNLNQLNDWSVQHVAQGFSWRAGSVSFGTLHNGIIQVEVTLVDEFPPLQQDTLRAIRVSFSVLDEGFVEI